MPVLVNAESVTTTTKIKTLNTFATYNESETKYRNTIKISVDSTTQGCEQGFYISQDDNLENSSLLTFLISAFHAYSNIRAGAYSDQLLNWSESNKICRINNLALVK